MFFLYNKRDIKRHRFHFFLSFSSVFVVVLSTLVVTSIIEKGPVIFLKLAQYDNGEIDAYITPTNQQSI